MRAIARLLLLSMLLLMLMLFFVYADTILHFLHRLVLQDFLKQAKAGTE